MEAYLQHGTWGGPYVTEKVSIMETDTPRSGQTVTGYGKKLPTPYMVQYLGKWRRVYCICFSNIGTYYIKGTPGSQDKDIVVSII